jgi:hypothetical protein
MKKKKKNEIRSSANVAQKASEILKDKRAGKNNKSVAGAALVNRKKNG